MREQFPDAEISKDIASVDSTISVKGFNPDWDGFCDT
jgi:hypothetical protein